MVSQIAGFTVLIVLVLGGICGAAFKYTLNGRVTANAGNRTNDSLWKEAMEQSHLTEAMEMGEANVSDRTEKDAERKAQHHGHDGMKMSHATA